MRVGIRRLREVDFIRGVAILLILFRHCHLFDFTDNMGWIGVDLFFVLSGFLVSGLLFREYKKYGNIRPRNFLIRRGFKIYPLYYLMYIFYLALLLSSQQALPGRVLADLVFVQNYVSGWGYAFEASWSLAVEEHFYFALALLLWLGSRNSRFQLTTDEHFTKISSVEKSILAAFFFVLILRLFSNLLFPDQLARNFTMTHLRIDSLLAGVFISYLYQFRKARLTYLLHSNKKLATLLIFAAFCWTPFINPVFSFFVKTIGFTLLYVACGIILTVIIIDPAINQRLDKIFSKTAVDGISKIGFASYSIYIVHPLVNKLFIDYLLRYVPISQYALFLITSVVSISLGRLMTNIIEVYFLRIRDRYYPTRANPVLPVANPSAELI